MAKIITRHEDGDANDVPTTLEFGELAVNSKSKKLWVGDSGTTPVLLSNSGGATLAEITQNSHGFVVGNAIRWNGVSAWVKAQANSADTLALGIVTNVRDANTFEYATSGRFNVPSHGLAVNEWLYLSDTVAGALTATEPFDISQPLVYADSADFFTVYPYRPAEINSDEKIPDGLADGQTLRWEADTSAWQANSDLIVTDTGNVAMGAALDVGADPKDPASYLATILANDGDVVVRNGNHFRTWGPSDTGGHVIKTIENNKWQIAQYDAGGDLARLTIDNTGNVGIGTATPAEALHISGSGTQRFRITEEGSGKYLNVLQTTNNCNFFAGSPSGDNELSFTTTLAGVFKEHMRITSTGNVGIGTTTPDSLLHLSLGGTADQGEVAMAIGNDSVTARQARIIKNTSTPYELKIRSKADAGGNGAPITFETKLDGEAMRLDASGNLLVGKTALNLATQGIELQGSIGLLNVTRSGGGAAQFNRLTDTGDLIIMRQNGNDVGSINVTASATSYTTSSDERLKKNIADAGDPFAKINAIQVREFDWKADDSHQDFGFIAQELVEVAPEAVSQGETEDDTWGVDPSKLVPVLVKAIQEQQALLTEQQEQIDELRGLLNV